MPPLSNAAADTIAIGPVALPKQPKRRGSSWSRQLVDFTGASASVGAFELIETSPPRTVSQLQTVRSLSHDSDRSRGGLWLAKRLPLNAGSATFARVAARRPRPTRRGRFGSFVDVMSVFVVIGVIHSSPPPPGGGPSDRAPVTAESDGPRRDCAVPSNMRRAAVADRVVRLAGSGWPGMAGRECAILGGWPSDQPGW